MLVPPFKVMAAGKQKLPQEYTLRQSGGLHPFHPQAHDFAPPPRGGFALSEVGRKNLTEMQGYDPEYTKETQKKSIIDVYKIYGEKGRIYLKTKSYSSGLY